MSAHLGFSLEAASLRQRPLAGSAPVGGASAPTTAIDHFLSEFTQGCEVGRGIAGRVVVARRRGVLHALKHIALGINADSQGSTRDEVEEEVALLKCLGHHPNVVELHDFCIDISSQRAVLVMSPGDMTLESFLQKRCHILPQELALHLALGMFSGISHIHQLDIIHRDLKPNNMLIHVAATGEVTLLICDFGQSRRPGLRPLTPGRQAVVYRCPEMILGEDEADYSFPIDIWAAGTIVAEMLCGQPLFSASCEIGMLFSIFRVLGTPSVQNWPGCTKLPGWKQSFPSFAGAPLTELTDASGLTLPSDMADLLAQALRYDPVARISAQEAVQHQCFKRAKRRQSHAEVDAEAEPRRGTASHPEDSGVPVPLPPPPLQLKGNGRCQCGGNCSRRRHAKGLCREPSEPGVTFCARCRCSAPLCDKTSLYPTSVCLGHFESHGLCDEFKAMTLTKSVTDLMLPMDIVAFFEARVPAPADSVGTGHKGI